MGTGTRTSSSTGLHCRAAAMVLCALALQPGPQSLRADELLDAGVELQRQGKLLEAVGLFSGTAEVGDPVAAYGMGVLYFQGTGVPKDMAQSTGWFRIAAEKGYAPAQYNLGNAYLHGRGTGKDLDQAAHWWRKSAQQGYTRAQFNMGALLHSNGNTPAMREEGIAWFRASAERGFAKSLEKLDAIGEPLDYAGIDPDPSREPLRSEARLITFDPQGSTMQLFAGSKPVSAEKYIAGKQLEGLALPFRFFRGKELWTAVVYGEYPSREQARSMIDSLKPELRNAKPWIRSLADVQGKIQQVWLSEEATLP